MVLYAVLRVKQASQGNKILQVTSMPVNVLRYILYLLITSANSLGPDRNVGPDLNPNCLTL